MSKAKRAAVLDALILGTTRNMTARFVVDASATVSSIPERLTRQVGLRVRRDGPSYEVFAMVHNPADRRVDVNFKVGAHKYTMKMNVGVDDVAVLGMDWLFKTCAKISFNPPRVEVQKKNGEWIELSGTQTYDQKVTGETMQALGSATVLAAGAAPGITAASIPGPTSVTISGPTSITISGPTAVPMPESAATSVPGQMAALISSSLNRPAPEPTTGSISESIQKSAPNSIPKPTPSGHQSHGATPETTLQEVKASEAKPPEATTAKAKLPNTTPREASQGTAEDDSKGLSKDDTEDDSESAPKDDSDDDAEDKAKTEAKEDKDRDKAEYKDKDKAESKAEQESENNIDGKDKEKAETKLASGSGPEDVPHGKEAGAAEVTAYIGRMEAPWLTRYYQKAGQVEDRRRPSDQMSQDVNHTISELSAQKGSARKEGDEKEKETVGQKQREDAPHRRPSPQTYEDEELCTRGGDGVGIMEDVGIKGDTQWSRRRRSVRITREINEGRHTYVVDDFREDAGRSHHRRSSQRTLANDGHISDTSGTRKRNGMWIRPLTPRGDAELRRGAFTRPVKRRMSFTRTKERDDSMKTSEKPMYMRALERLVWGA